MTQVTTGISKNVKAFPVMCLTSLRDQWNGTAQIVNKYALFYYYYYYFYLGFLSRTFTIRRTAGEGGDSLINSSLPLLPTSQTIRHEPGNYYRELTNTINHSLKGSTFPDELKQSEVIPVYKKLDHLHKENYRPVSLLPHI